MIKEVKINPLLSYEKLSGLIDRADDPEKMIIAEQWLIANTAISKTESATLENLLRMKVLAEAKKRIGQNFMNGFYAWLKDEKEMDEKEYSKKYGWGKGEVKHGDNFNSLKAYMESIFCGRNIKGWEKEGYKKETIWALRREGFFSLLDKSGRESFYYISQRTAREIYKEHKAKKSV